MPVKRWIDNILFKYILLAFYSSIIVFANSIRVVGASDLTYALQEIKEIYLKNNPNSNISISLGSSGKAYTQILHQAPYDIYFSADMDYVDKLYKKGFTIDKPKVYAFFVEKN